MDEAVHLEAGSYALRYCSDDAHSYKAWYSSAPDHLYWVIRVRREP